MERTKEEIVELHFGSDFHEVKEPCYLDHICNAMQEYADQELSTLQAKYDKLKEGSERNIVRLAYFVIRENRLPDSEYENVRQDLRIEAGLEP